MEIDKAPGPAPRRLEPARRSAAPTERRSPQGGARPAARRSAGCGRPRRGGNQRRGTRCAPGRYTATLGKQVGETVTPIGTPQVFRVSRRAQWSGSVGNRPTLAADFDELAEDWSKAELASA